MALTVKELKKLIKEWWMEMRLCAKCGENEILRMITIEPSFPMVPKLFGEPRTFRERRVGVCSECIELIINCDGDTYFGKFNKGGWK